MATAEKESLLKNMKIKIKGPEEDKSPNSKNRYNISGSNEVKEENKDSSKVSGEENKEIINLNMMSQEKDSNSDKSNNSKVIKENPEEVENNKNNESKSSESIESSEKKSSEKSSDNEEEKNNSEKNANDNSSFLNSKDDKEEQNDEENEEENEENHYLNRKDPFMTTGKFMQIQPHFNLFNKRINTLREGIYDNTKKCLMYKSSLQMSENLMRERANSIVRDFVEKLYNLKEMFINSNTDAESIINETRKGIMNLENVEKRNKSAIKDCDYRLNRCERQIGYKLLGKPNYSFMKRVCNTTFNKK
jgi:hypothetical protein